MKRHVIDCTDLYHPHQDPGDNFDIVAAYALPEIDLRAIILDVTERFRQPICAQGPPGPREPGIVPLTQMNYIYGRQVPFAVSPFNEMRSVDDKMETVTAFEQGGIELLLQSLREAPSPVDILIFCSCRVIAAAFNRNPDLFREKVRMIHLCAGTASGEVFDVDWEKHKRIPVANGSKGFREWNVELDVHAFVRILRSGLPLALYPCASEDGPFALHRHNTFFQLGTLRFIRELHPQIRNYLVYAFTHQLRHDFLRAMELDCESALLDKVDAITWHPVWETAVWLEVSGRKLVHRPGVGYRIVAPTEVQTHDRILKNDQTPCRLTIRDDGSFDFELSESPTGITIYDRGDELEENQRALCEALPELYRSFQPCLSNVEPNV